MFPSMRVIDCVSKNFAEDLVHFLLLIRKKWLSFVHWHAATCQREYDKAYTLYSRERKGTREHPSKYYTKLHWRQTVRVSLTAITNWYPRKTSSFVFRYAIPILVSFTLGHGLRFLRFRRCAGKRKWAYTQKYREYGNDWWTVRFHRVI